MSIRSIKKFKMSNVLKMFKFILNINYGIYMFSYVSASFYFCVTQYLFKKISFYAKQTKRF